MDKIISSIFKILFIIATAYFAYNNYYSIAAEAGTIHISLKYITFIIIGIYIGWAMYKTVREIIYLSKEIYNFCQWICLTILDRSPGEFVTYATRNERASMHEQLEANPVYQEKKRQEAIKENFYTTGIIDNELSYIFGLEDGQIAGKLKGIKNVYEQAYTLGQSDAYHDRLVAAEEAKRREKEDRNEQYRSEQAKSQASWNAAVKQNPDWFPGSQGPKF